MAAPRSGRPTTISSRIGSSPALAALAGPALIVGSVLVLTRGFWLGGRLTNEHVDLLSFWLPRWCAMGKAVVHGQIPTWLPNQFAGVPFASDPQSGWLYLPVLLLFGSMSCTRALGLFITLNPILAGLGVYWFFRGERAGRPAATAGGLAMAMSIAGSIVILSMPFAGTLAWTGMTLAAVSGFLHARTRRSAAAWLAFAGLAWGQIAAAHLTDGLLIGSVVVGLYALARLVAQVRTNERTLGSAALAALVPSLALPLLSAAILVPRLALLPRTSIGQGYVQLGRLTRDLGGFTGSSAVSLSPLMFTGTGPWWATAFARGPGAYVGALAILLVPVAFASKRWRLPAAAFALSGVAGWALNQDRLIHSGFAHRVALEGGLGELWLRDPYRFRYLLLLAFAGLAGYGVQAWLDWARPPDRAAMLRRWAPVAAAAIVFVLAPLAAGSRPSLYLPFVLGAAATLPLLWLVATDRWAGTAAVLLPVVLAVELTATAVAGQIAGGGGTTAGTAVVGGAADASGLGRAFPTWHSPGISAAAYLTPGPIGRTLVRFRADGGRYLSFAPQLAASDPRGFLFHQDPQSWGAYANGRSVLFGLSEIQGYSPVQLMRYWRYLRSLDTALPIYYNSATFQFDPRQMLDLFGVEWVIQQSSPQPAPPGGTSVATEGDWTLYRIGGWQQRASVVYQWDLAPAGEALNEVLRPDFNPALSAVVERVPTLDGSPLQPSGPSHGPAGITAPSTTYRELSPEHVRVRVTTASPGLAVVRNPWDVNWHATLDGRPVPLLAADSVMQAVAVPAGTNTIDLFYRDTAIGKGALVSGVSWAVLLIAGAWLWRRRRRTQEALTG
jgi:hypothetical protein